MPGGSRRLDIVYHLDTGPADKAADGYAQRQEARSKRILTDEEALQKARQRLTEKTNQAMIAAAMKAEQAEEAKLRNIISKEEVAERAREQLLAKYNAKRVELAALEMQGQDKALRITMEGLDKKLAKYNAQNQSIGEGVAAIGRFGAAMLGLQGAQQVLGAIGGIFAQIRQSAFEAAKSVQQMRGDVRELQALRGEMGQTGPGIAHVFSIASETLQSTDEVKAMESAGLGVGELALKTDEDRQQFTKAMVAAGRFQQLEGGDAGAYGQMMGQIALQSQGPINAEDMEARAYRLFQIQQPGGFKSMSQAMGQYSKLNGLVQNGIYTPEEAMGLASAFSVSSPEEAATRTDQFTRAVMAGRIKSRGMQVSSDVDLLKTDEYFKELGIGEDDTAIQRGKKISDDLARRKADAQAKGGQFNSYEYLMTRGFGNAEDREAIMELSGLRNSGRLEKIEKAQNADLERGAISRRFADRAATDPYYQTRRAELAEQGAGIQQGLREEPLVAAQRAAFARLRAQGKISGNFDEWQRIERGGLSGATEGGIQDMFHSNYHSQVTREMMHSLEGERKRLGMGRIMPGMTEGAHDYELRFAQAIKEKGGDVTAGSAEDLKALTASIKDLTTEMKRQPGRNPVPPTIPGRPAPQPMRP